MQQPLALWSQLFKGLYFPTQAFLSINPVARASWGWKSLLLGRNAIAPHLCWSVGDGRDIKIRGDRWLPFGTLYGPNNKDDPLLVADLIDPTHQTWNQPQLLSLLGEDITAQVLNIPIRHIPIVDHIIWTGTKDGKYTVKSCYHKLCQQATTTDSHTASTSYQNPKSLWRRIWSMKTAPKIRVFTWALC